MLKQLFSAAVVLGCCTILLGCGEGGPRLAKATGKVNYKGQPVAGANVQFVSDTNGLLAIGTTDSQGVFTLTTGGRVGASLGTHKVGITKPPPSDIKAPATMKPEDMMNMAKERSTSSPPVIPKSEIPETYADPTKSKLVAEVTTSGGKNEFEFNLVD